MYEYAFVQGIHIGKIKKLAEVICREVSLYLSN